MLTKIINNNNNNNNLKKYNNNCSNSSKINIINNNNNLLKTKRWLYIFNRVVINKWYQLIKKIHNCRLFHQNKLIKINNNLIAIANRIKVIYNSNSSRYFSNNNLYRIPNLPLKTMLVAIKNIITITIIIQIIRPIGKVINL